MTNSGITETNFFVHFFFMWTILSLKSQKRSELTILTIARVYACTQDTHAWTSYVGKEEQILPTESVFNQAFQNNYLFWTDEIIYASLVSLFSLFSFIFISLAAIPSELHQIPGKNFEQVASPFSLHRVPPMSPFVTFFHRWLLCSLTEWRNFKMPPSVILAAGGINVMQPNETTKLK